MEPNGNEFYGLPRARDACLAPATCRDDVLDFDALCADVPSLLTRLESLSGQISVADESDSDSCTSSRRSRTRARARGEGGRGARNRVAHFDQRSYFAPGRLQEPGQEGVNENSPDGHPSGSGRQGRTAAAILRVCGDRENAAGDRPGAKELRRNAQPLITQRATQITKRLVGPKRGLARHSAGT